ncbi:MAG: 2-polyprenyl-3-methyl-5-hydroxy-6-metoxy-1,4-benzoquinol methylase [Paracoccaceae bacterium]|jgi:2-polyprenyl-3-methyl-5-hydroxy-6-metoxy-1,4-benzoquinol methylase
MSKYLSEMAETGYAPDTISDYHYTMIPWLLKQHGVDLDARIADFGSGSGHILIPMADAGWKNLVAVDIHELQFQLFRETYGSEAVLWDANEPGLDLADASVQAITCFHLIEHLKNGDHLLAEAFRILKPGGTLFLATPDWNKCVRTFYNDPTHIRPYTKNSIARLLRMYGFDPSVYSWNSRYGLGRLKLYRWWPRTAMIGVEMLAVAKKPL